MSYFDLVCSYAARFVTLIPHSRLPAWLPTGGNARGGKDPVGGCGPAAHPPGPPSRHPGRGHPRASWRSTAAQLASADRNVCLSLPANLLLARRRPAARTPRTTCCPTWRLEDGGCVAAAWRLRGGLTLREDSSAGTLLGSPSAAGSRAYFPKGARETSYSECLDCCVGVKPISQENAQQPVCKTCAAHQLWPADDQGGQLTVLYLGSAHGVSKRQLLAHLHVTALLNVSR